jgi:hypothetical protein
VESLQGPVRERRRTEDLVAVDDVSFEPESATLRSWLGKSR